jgi:hypothetical protein
MGLLLAVLVTAADVDDAKGAAELFCQWALQNQPLMGASKPARV